jgi:hypothetical protein
MLSARMSAHGVAQPPTYRSYVLRCWEERSQAPAMSVWRCSLENPLTGQRHGFANLEALLGWLQADLAAEPAPPGQPPVDGGGLRIEA